MHRPLLSSLLSFAEANLYDGARLPEYEEGFSRPSPLEAALEAMSGAAGDVKHRPRLQAFSEWKAVGAGTGHYNQQSNLPVEAFPLNHLQARLR